MTSQETCIFNPDSIRWPAYLYMTSIPISNMRVQYRNCVMQICVINILSMWWILCMMNILDFTPSTRCKWGLRSSGMLHSVDWWLVTDVSGPPIGPIFKGQVVQAFQIFLDCWHLRMGPIRDENLHYALNGIHYTL